MMFKKNQSVTSGCYSDTEKAKSAKEPDALTLNKATLEGSLRFVDLCSAGGSECRVIVWDHETSPSALIDTILSECGTNSQFMQKLVSPIKGWVKS